MCYFSSTLTPCLRIDVSIIAGTQLALRVSERKYGFFLTFFQLLTREGVEKRLALEENMFDVVRDLIVYCRLYMLSQ